MVVLLAALSGCAEVADDELSADKVCENLASNPFLRVDAVSDERGAGLSWDDMALGRNQDQTFRLHRRAAGAGDDAWEQVGDVVLTPDDAREIVPVDLPPGRWEVGITHVDPECGESDLCLRGTCSSAVVEVATEPEPTSWSRTTRQDR